MKRSILALAAVLALSACAPAEQTNPAPEAQASTAGESSREEEDTPSAKDRPGEQEPTDTTQEAAATFAEVGDCYNYSSIRDWSIDKGQQVPCTAEHTAITIAVYDNYTLPFGFDTYAQLSAISERDKVSEEQYAQFSGVLEAIQEQCLKDVNEAVGLPSRKQGGTWASLYSTDVRGVSQEQWEAGERDVACNLVKRNAKDETLYPLENDLSGQGIKKANQACMLTDSEGVERAVECPSGKKSAWMQILRGAPVPADLPTSDKARSKALGQACASAVQARTKSQYRQDVDTAWALRWPSTAKDIDQALEEKVATLACYIPSWAYLDKVPSD